MTVIGKQPLVSIITPVHNGAEHLDELIQSVLQQDYPHIEHIAIDDGSTDNGATVAILQRYPHLRWWSRENKGQYATLNEGLSAAHGSILGIISADDMYVAPSAISSVVRYWQEHPEYGFVYGRTWLVDSAGAHMHPKPTDVTWHLPVPFLRYRMLIPHCSLFVAKEIVMSCGIWFDPHFRYAGDWDWIVRLSLTGYKFGYLHQPLSLYRQHDAQTTLTTSYANVTLELREILRRHHSSYGMHLLVTYCFWLLKGWRALRAGGPLGLSAAMQVWWRRQSLRG